MSRKHDEEMTCREFVETVTEYLEGALSDERRAALHAHIDECGGCNAYLAQMKHTISALRGLDGTGISPQARNAALAAFRAHRDGPA